MANLLCISGSPRIRGNTDLLLDSVVRTAGKTGVKTKRLNLDKLKLLPCRDCGCCGRTGVCSIRDGMAVVFKALEWADIVVVGSPVYFGNISAQTKIMVDRMQCKWVEKYVLRKPRRKARVGAFILCGARNDERYFECAVNIIKIFYNVQWIDFNLRLYFAGVDKKGDIKKQKGAIVSVEKMTRKLISSYGRILKDS